MEAASVGATLLARDGSLPTSPGVAPTRLASDTHPIDGVIRCGCCLRLPLVGEPVTRHRSRKGGTDWACGECERSGRAASLGEIVERERVRSLGGAMNVRRAA